MASRSPQLGHTLGRLFAVCVRLQREVAGTLHLAAEYHQAARTTPARVFPYLYRVAEHYAAMAGQESERAIAAAGLMWRVNALAEEVDARGGCPAVLADDAQAAFLAGFHAEWRQEAPGASRGTAADAARAGGGDAARWRGGQAGRAVALAS